MWLPWEVAMVFAIGLGTWGWFARPRRRGLIVASAFAREAALVLVLYSIWQFAGQLSIAKVEPALDRGRWIWDVQRALRFPSELAFQQAALPHPLLVQASNIYYATVHAPALILALLWLFTRHRERYPLWRNAIALTTGVCLAIQLLPVAPPRFLPELGFVDTARLYGQSVYGPPGTGLSAGQVSAMPSVHIAWAVAIGLAVVLVSTSRWRWLILAHPVATAYVVVVTANHWWLDGVVAVAILLVALAGLAWWHGRRARRPAPAALAIEPARGGEPAPDAPMLTAAEPGRTP